MTREEFQNRFFIRRLLPNENIEGFDCLDDDLNDFLINEATLYDNALLSVTYLVIERSNSKIAAYFSLANDKVSISDFENTTDFNRFRKKKFVNSKRLRSYPAIKIGRLAIDKNNQHQSIGTYLIEFISNYFLTNNKAGCRFLTVDAYRAAIRFYLNNDFSFLNNDDTEKHTRVMFFDLVSLI